MLIPKTCEWDHMGKGVFAYEIKDPEMEESSWFNWMSSKSSDKYPYESKEKRALREERRPCTTEAEIGMM